jgi:hypothetical protein
VKIRADVAELLHAGHSDIHIARELHIDRSAVGRMRAHLGLPKSKPGPRASASPEDLFRQRIQIVGEHADWVGYRTSHGCPGLRYGGRFYTAYRLAFRIANGREPEGKALPDCGHDRCVMPGHQADRRMRAEARRVDDLYAAISGETA